MKYVLFLKFFLKQKIVSAFRKIHLPSENTKLLAFILYPRQALQSFLFYFFCLLFNFYFFCDINF